jgi:hypothetical protein
VENDLRVMKVKRRGKKSQNREEWASVIREPKFLKGRLSQVQSNETRKLTITVRTLLCYLFMSVFFYDIFGQYCPLYSEMSVNISRLHGATSQMTAIFTVMKTENYY